MALIIWIVCQNLVSIIAGVLIVPIFKDVLTESEFNLITMIITMLSGLLLGSLFIFSYTNKNEKIAKKKLSLVKKIEIIFIGIFLIGIVQITLPYLYELFNLEYLVGDIIPYKAQENIFTDILLVICISIIPGIFEELFFRKAIMDYSNSFCSNTFLNNIFSCSYEYSTKYVCTRDGDNIWNYICSYRGYSVNYDITLIK